MSQRGFAYLGQDRTAEAAADFQEALRAADDSGSLQARSTAIESLGLTALTAGRYGEALRHFDEALTLAADSAEPLARRAIGLLRHHRGRALTGLGRHPEALTELTAVRVTMREIGDRYNEGRVLTSLGAAQRAAGQSDQAIGSLTEALHIMRVESVFQAAEVAVALADLAEERAEPADIRAYLEEALSGYQRRGAPQTTRVAERLAGLPPR